MPNHVTTLCTITGSNDAIERFEKDHFIEGKFDFNTIVPMPDCVRNVEDSNVAEKGLYALTGIIRHEFACFGAVPPMFNHPGFVVEGLTTYDNFRDYLEKNDPDILEKGRAMIRSFRESGHFSWYDWAIEHWGTKWNAYELQIVDRTNGRLVFRFETAWAVPRPVLRALAAGYSSLTFEIASIDEGGPEYVGRFHGNDESFEKVEPSADRYLKVYGRTREQDDEDDEDGAVETAP